MKVARHPKPPEVANLTLEEIADRYTARFRDRVPDWSAFADALIDGYRRAQHRYIGNISRKPGSFIPAGNFTLGVMYVPPGQGNAPHTHEAEEVFFVLKGHLTVFLEEEDGRRLELKLGPWDLVSCPAGVIHGFQNESLEPVYVQIVLGTGRPEFMGYAEPELYASRDAHLRPKKE